MISGFGEQEEGDVAVSPPSDYKNISSSCPKCQEYNKTRDDNEAFRIAEAHFKELHVEIARLQKENDDLLLLNADLRKALGIKSTTNIRFAWCGNSL